MEKTILTYLDNTYLFESTAKIIEAGNNDFGEYIILNSTIFYPQGGGQPTDTGVINIINTADIFNVSMVKLDENGVVYHYGNFTKKNTNIINSEVSLKINSESRIKNAQNHTAGHLIDICVKNIALNISAEKGYHFEPGCYVEYGGIIEGLGDGDNKEILIKKINTELEKIISEERKIIVEEISEDISHGDSPEGKSYRFVYINGYKDFGCGCGGTHLSNTSEIGKIEITKIRTKKGKTKISYRII